jgi:SAM-dependent methyltransferase
MQTTATRDQPPDKYAGRTKAVPFVRRIRGEPRFPPPTDTVPLVDGGVARTESVPCVLCGSADAEPIVAVADWRYGLTDAVFRIVRCASCQLSWLDPRPAASDIGRFYPAPYYDRRLPESGGPDRVAAHGLRPEAMAERAALCGDGERVLDVGCADGGFLEHMRGLGWEVQGVERSPEAAASGRSQRGIPIIDKPLTAAGLPREHYDVITFWASLEHVHDPVAYLTEARRLLRSGGRVVILIQNFASPTVRHLHWGLDPPRHLYHFTPRTMTAALRRAGFAGPIAFTGRTKVLDGSLHGQIAKIGRRIYRLHRREGGSGLARTAGWALARFARVVAPASWLLTALGRNGVMIVTARVS